MSVGSDFYLRRGFDIRLEGVAEKQLAEVDAPVTCAGKAY